MGAANTRTVYVYIMALDFMSRSMNPTDLLGQNLGRAQMSFRAHLADKPIADPVFSSPAVGVRNIATNIRTDYLEGSSAAQYPEYLNEQIPDPTITGVQGWILATDWIDVEFQTEQKPSLAEVLSRVPIAHRLRGRVNAFLADLAFRDMTSGEPQHYLAFSHCRVAEMAALDMRTPLLNPGDIMGYEMRVFLDGPPRATLQQSWVLPCPDPR